VAAETFCHNQSGDHRRRSGPVKQVQMDEYLQELTASPCVQSKISVRAKDEFHTPPRDHQPAAPPVAHIAQGVDASATRRRGRRSGHHDSVSRPLKRQSLMRRRYTMPCRSCGVCRGAQRRPPSRRCALTRKASFPCAMKTATCLACPHRAVERSTPTRPDQPADIRVCPNLITQVLPEGWITPEHRMVVKPDGNIRDWRSLTVNAGLTGRKSSDTYAGAGPHGGGAFSGKVRKG